MKRYLKSANLTFWEISKKWFSNRKKKLVFSLDIRLANIFAKVQYDQKWYYKIFILGEFCRKMDVFSLYLSPFFNDLSATVVTLKLPD